jgi:hypothetical protein
MTTAAAKKAAEKLGEIIKFLPQTYEADVEIKSLVDWPGNPKDHDIGAIVESMRENGVYGALRCQLSTRRILAGHGTREALRRLKVRRVNVLWIDCDDATGARIVAADNRLSELGGYNDAALLDYLRTLQESNNLKGTGYDADDVTTLYEHVHGEYENGERDRDAEGDDDDDDEKASFDYADHDRILSVAFEWFRENGFPYRKLPLFVQLQELNRLAALSQDAALRSTFGYAIADSYHPERFEVAIEGKRRAIDVFKDDKSLLHALELQLDSSGRIPAGHFGALDVVHGAQVASNFRPGFAMHLYRRFCDAGAYVLDPCAGYGGRLIGWLAALLGGTYTGVDPNTQTHLNNQRMIEALVSNENAVEANVQLINKPFEDLVNDENFGEEMGNVYDFVFTSPPYFSKEHYNEGSTQSYIRYPTIEQWVECFLQKLLDGSYWALKAGKVCAINISDVTIPTGGTTYELQRYTVECAERAGFIHRETLRFDFGKRVGGGEQSIAVEPVFIFVKPE